MSNHRFGPSDPPSNLVVLPMAEDLQRERVSDERIHQQPHTLQSWFEASGQDPAADDRLGSFIDGLLGEPSAETVAEGAPLQVEPVTLDDEGPSTLEIRQARQQRRLAAQPLVLMHWFEAAVEGGAADRRLRAFAAQQLQTPVETRSSQLRSSQLRPWIGLAVAACALLAIGVAGWMGRSPVDAEQPTEPPEVSELASVEARDPLVEEPTAPSAQPGQVQPIEQQAALPQLAGMPAPALPAPALPAPSFGPVQVGAVEAPKIAIIEAVPLSIVADVAPTVLAQTSPSLSTAGEIDASTVPWRGMVVPGLDLKVDQGFGILAGTEAEPLLSLATDSAVRVDLDRSAVAQGFSTFTIQTPSGTVRVLGTRYTVRTPSGRTEVATRRGLVQVECQDGRRKLVAAGQSESCEALADAGLRSHMQALDRPSLPNEVRLTELEQYNHLQRQLANSKPEAFVATADLMLSGALSDNGLRRVIEAVRVDALCALGWNGPARRAATIWLESEGTVGRDRLSSIASGGCDEG